MLPKSRSLKLLLSRSLKACAILSLSVFLTGCQEKNPTSTHDNSPKPVNSDQTISKRRVSVEQMKEGSGESWRKHVFDEFGREIETEIKYEIGLTETRYLRENGSIRESVALEKNGKERWRVIYSENGSAIVSGFENRSDGTNRWTAETLADGSVKTITYWYDGKRVFSEELRKNTSIEQVFYRKSGKIWIKRDVSSPEKLTHYQYDSKGDLELIAKSLEGGSYEITRYKDGVIRTKQIFRRTANTNGYVSWTMLRTDEFDKTGTQIQLSILMDPRTLYPVEVRRLRNDGNIVVRRMHSSCSTCVESEEILDKNGSRISFQSFRVDEGVRDNIEIWRFGYVDIIDPKVPWKLQEDYPAYRNSYE